MAKKKPATAAAAAPRKNKTARHPMVDRSPLDPVTFGDLASLGLVTLPTSNQAETDDE